MSCIARFRGDSTGEVPILVPVEVNTSVPILTMVEREVVAPILVLVYDGVYGRTEAGRCACSVYFAVMFYVSSVGYITASVCVCVWSSEG